MMLASEFLLYWTHRSLHKIPSLWRVHAMHHSSMRMDWLASARVHPIEVLATRFLSVLPLFLCGFPPEIAALYSPWLGMYQIFVHGNFGWSYGLLKYVFVSPAFHRWRHAAEEEALDKNFSSLFSFYDYIFGTAYFPAAARPERYGLHEEQMPASLAGQLAYPFR